MRQELECTKRTLITVESHKLDQFIKQETGHEYCVMASEQLSDDDRCEISVDGQLDDYDNQEWNKFKESGRYSDFRTNAILNGLCSQGLIEAGDYLITTC